MRISWRSEVLSLALIAAMLVLAGLTWGAAPERLPVHWDIKGTPDRFGGKAEGLLAIPATAVGIYVLMLVLPRFDPRRRHYELFAGVYNLIRTLLVAFLFALYLVVVLWARGIPVRVEKITPLLVGALLIVLGSYMGKLRSTWFVGIRTPWTLSSEESWNKTHRLGGKVFILGGAASILVGLLRSEYAVWAMIALLAGGMLALTVFSYIWWKHDPNRQEIP
ncbi:MAG: SdpI family protein [bacterium]|nr:SdpI family protein [bacterium]